MENIKENIKTEVESHRAELLRLSHQVHDRPELGLKEYYAVERTRALLENCGYSVNVGIGGLETAFMATKEGRPGGVHVAFLAEYDALPEIGHGCGHNVILTCAVGAFLGMAAAMDGLCGRVSLIGTPGEENAAGKVTLLEQHIFDDVDFALMIHPSSGPSLIHRGGRACTDMGVTFRGKSAHSSVPATGINALSAVIATFNHIDLMRPTFAMQDNINGIITEGGTARNVIPDHTACEFCLRAQTLLELEALVEKVKKAVECASALTGATAEVEVGAMYAERYTCLPVCEAFKANMESLGEPMEYPDPNGMLGSSDVGNVSIKLPAIHDYLSIAPAEVNGHSRELADAAASPRADEVCIRGAQGLAMTAADLFSSEALRTQAKEYHEKTVPAEYKKRGQ
ncbi:MAG: amidohydrolase [Clostridiaceae bacterium]|nr:amidohydrolase [Clostridiaceae bacterium]